VHRIAPILAPIANVFAAIEHVFSAVADLLTPVAYILAPITYILDAIADSTPRGLAVGRHGDSNYEYRCAGGKEQFG
jgi:hypothetical protein